MRTGKKNASERKKRNRAAWPTVRLAEWIVDRLKPYEDKKNGKADGERRRQFHESLLLLHSGRQETLREYYVKKYRQVLLAVLGMVFLLAGAAAASYMQELQIPDGQLLRPGYMEGAAEQELTVLAEGESEAQPLTVTVSGRRFSSEQVQQLLSAAEQELDRVMPGENESPDEVRSALLLPSSLADGAVQVSYVMVPYGVIGEDGSILKAEEKDGTLVEIQARLTCQDEARELLRTVCVLPPVLTEEEAFWESVLESVQEADETEIEEAFLTLPPSAGGRTLIWRYPREPWLKLALAALLLVPLFIWYRADSRVKEQMQLRERQLHLDYGELMWKMTMLSGAGLTIRAVFFRIANEYLEEQKTVPRYAYEEVVRTCREMKSGVPEAAAYENFGRRCGQQAYIRLGSLLSQNLKKGSKGLTEILEKEAQTAMDERRGSAKEMGEKAATRLLMPMVLLLLVVLIALTLPCVLAF